MNPSRAADSGPRVRVGAGGVYRSYAKINLYLDVLGQRHDGYHQIETVFQTVGLFDELRVEVTGRALELTCSVSSLDTGPANLVLRAASLLREHTGCTQGARMQLVKRIPVAAGLAGGSGNAAATLIALNDLWGLALGDAELSTLALALGSDVPYCLRGGAQAGTGRGETLRPLGPLPECWVVLVHPMMAIGTASVYAHPKLGCSREAAVDGRTPRFAEALGHLESAQWADALYNRMETPVFADYPQLARLKEALVSAGCAAALMSGSGPTIFGLCPSESEARRIASVVHPARCSVAPFVERAVVRQ